MSAAMTIRHAFIRHRPWVLARGLLRPVSSGAPNVSDIRGCWGPTPAPDQDSRRSILSLANAGAHPATVRTAAATAIAIA